jgi:hypothetical protein
MAQRKRAGLITRRSLDRNELQLILVFLHPASSSCLFSCHCRAQMLPFPSDSHRLFCTNGEELKDTQDRSYRSRPLARQVSSPLLPACMSSKPTRLPHPESRDTSLCNPPPNTQPRPTLTVHSTKTPESNPARREAALKRSLRLRTPNPPPPGADKWSCTGTGIPPVHPVSGGINCSAAEPAGSSLQPAANRAQSGRENA